MANNCLVTKLMDSVDNPNLEKLGILCLEFVNGSDGMVSFTKDTEITLQNGTFNSTGNNKRVVSANTFFYFTSGNCTLSSGSIYKVEVPKYHLSSIQNPNPVVDVDMEKLFKWSDANSVNIRITNGCTLSKLNSITDRMGGDIRFAGTNVFFNDVWDVTQLGTSETLTRALLTHIPSHKVIGSFDNLGLSALDDTNQAISFPSGNLPYVTFELVNFVRKNISKSRTSGSLRIIHLGAANTTFNGNLVTTDASKNYVLSWVPSATSGKTDVTLTEVGAQQGTTITIDNQ